MTKPCMDAYMDMKNQNHSTIRIHLGLPVVTMRMTKYFSVSLVLANLAIGAA